MPNITVLFVVKTRKYFLQTFICCTHWNMYFLFLFILFQILVWRELQLVFGNADPATRQWLVVLMFLGKQLWLRFLSTYLTVAPLPPQLSELQSPDWVRFPIPKNNFRTFLLLAVNNKDSLCQIFIFYSLISSIFFHVDGVAWKWEANGCVPKWPLNLNFRWGELWEASNISRRVMASLPSRRPGWAYRQESWCFIRNRRDRNG